MSVRVHVIMRAQGLTLDVDKFGDIQFACLPGGFVVVMHNDPSDF